MKTTTLSHILTWSVLFSFFAHAQSEPRGPREPRGQRQSFQKIWETYDADRDGFLSLAEFQVMPRVARLPEEKQVRLFQRLDKNADGKISREELREIRQSGDGRRLERGMRRLMELDSNNSGGVCIDEFRAGEMFENLAPERVEALFRRLDTDGDGEITPKDRPELPPVLRQSGGQRGDRPTPHRRIFNQLDADQSGTLDFQEFRKARGIAPLEENAQEGVFTRLDLDRDKRLSFEEFSQAPLAEISPPPRRGGDGRRRGRPATEPQSRGASD